MESAPQPFLVERDPATHDVVAYRLLCPVCKQYTVLSVIHWESKRILDGEIRFRCKSDICKWSTWLQVIHGRAVATDMPAPDIKKDAPKQPTTLFYEIKSTASFIREAYRSKN